MDHMKSEKLTHLTFAFNGNTQLMQPILRNSQFTMCLWRSSPRKPLFRVRSHTYGFFLWSIIRWLYPFDDNSGNSSSDNWNGCSKNANLCLHPWSLLGIWTARRKVNCLHLMKSLLVVPDDGEPDWTQSERDVMRKRADGRIQPSVAACCARLFAIKHLPPSHLDSLDSPPISVCRRSSELGFDTETFVSRFVRSPGFGGGGEITHVTSRWLTSKRSTERNCWLTTQAAEAFENLGQKRKKNMFCTGSSAFVEIIFGPCISTVCLEGCGLLPCSPATSPVKFFASRCRRFVSTRSPTIHGRFAPICKILEVWKKNVKSQKLS